jgi:uncharacterized repeat protein (TIGR01451 family)
LSCRHDVAVSYSNPSNYLPDSAQFQQTGQKTPVTTFVIPSSSFHDGYKNPDVSEDNNFGLVGYGLSIVKYFSGNSALINGTETFFPMLEAVYSEGMSKNYAAIESGDFVYYTIAVNNFGPTDATGVVVTDDYPSNMQVLSVTTTNKPSTKPNPVIDSTSTAGKVKMSLGDPVASGESYTFLVKTKVVGPAMSLVTNNSTIYANGGVKGDSIESGFDPKQFSDNEDPETITIKQCKVDGVVYLDVNNNKTFEKGIDIVQANQDITINNGLVTKSMKTNGSGYYLFDELSCRYPWNILFENSTSYLEDSAQFQQTTQSSL